VGSAPSSRETQSTLARRLARLSLVRLTVLTVFLALVSLVYLRGVTEGYSSQVAFSTVIAGYALAAVYASLLRLQRFLGSVAHAQIVTDQLLWTAIVYLTGGVGSGAVSLYGLTVVVAAIVLGVRGAVFAWVVGAAAYVGMTTLLVEGVLLPPPDQDPSVFATTWRTAGYPLGANLLALAVVAAMCGYLAERLRTTGGDLLRAEARAAAAERLAGLGRLAAGLAHEIRNPLGGISGSIELLRASPNLTDEDRQLCDIVQRESSRLNDLVGDMLQLSRPREPTFAEVDLARVASEVVELASKSGRGEDVRVRYQGPPGLVVRADSAQLRQLLWNLIRNAVQSSAAGSEVVVTVAALSSGGARLDVQDAGKGIAPDAMDKIFDAFFTTRAQGTGMGLAVVKHIVDAHGWKVSVRSDDAGAVFSVTVRGDE
jgi:two-component system, NtrC family, sensor histidine kinase HydH